MPKAYIRLFSKKGLTFIEAMIVLAIISVVGVGMAQTLRSGLSMWTRARNVENDEDIRLFFERITHDLRRLAVFSRIEFTGQKSYMSFPIVSTGDTSRNRKLGDYYAVDQIKYVRYRLDTMDDVIFRDELDMAQFYGGSKGISRRMLDNICSFNIKYFSSGNEEYKNRDMRDDVDCTPRFIRVDLVFWKNDKEKGRLVSELFEIPLARTLRKMVKEEEPASAGFM